MRLVQVASSRSLTHSVSERQHAPQSGLEHVVPSPWYTPSRPIGGGCSHASKLGVTVQLNVNGTQHAPPGPRLVV